MKKTLAFIMAILMCSGTAFTSMECEVFADETTVTDVESKDFVVENGVITKCLNKEITELVIPDGIRGINERVFEGCEKLKSISMTNSVTYIGTQAFAHCFSLENVKMSCNVGKNDIVVDENISGEPIDNGIFAGYMAGKELGYKCPGITLTYDDSKAMIPYVDEETNEEKLRETDLVIRESSIRGSEAIKEVIIPDGYRAIDNYAFSECVNLKNVSMTNSVTYIGTRAFAYCCSLENVKMSCNVGKNDIVVDENISGEPIDNGIFAGYMAGKELGYKCPGITLTYDDSKAMIPYIDEETNEEKFKETDLVIRESSIRGSEAIKEVIIPDGYRAIDNYAFSECVNLKSVSFPDTITYIADNSFDHVNVKDMEVKTTNEYVKSYFAKLDSTSTPTVSYGDLNADGKVDLTDLTMLSLYLLGDKKFDESQLASADVNGDGEIDIADLAHFKQYISKDDVVLGK